MDNRIEDKEYFESLKTWEKFYVIEDAKIKIYRFVSFHPKLNDYVLAINDNCYSNITNVKMDFENSNIVYLKSYDSYEVGEIMISQLEKKIEHVKSVYIDKSW